MTMTKTIPGRRPLGLFEAIGIELEYMIVDAGTLDVLPICDRVLAVEAARATATAGAPRAQTEMIVSDVERGPISWSNELALHVVELKTSGPAPDPLPLAGEFQADIDHMQALLAPLGARLMPTAMHPWMDPLAEMRLWPHEYSAVYAAYDRIFGCRGHGYANLQSVHINLPFANAAEFGRLHAAIRTVLPILPALAASSPIMDGVPTGRLDNRLEVYRHNADAVPSVAGRVIPEPVFTPELYDAEILQRIYRDIAPHDPDGILRYEFANARGAIARFDRDAIEIRVLDIQECPRADMAIACLIVAVLRMLVDEHLSPYADQRALAVDPLADLFEYTILTAEATPVSDPAFLVALGWHATAGPPLAGQLWRFLRTRALERWPALVAPFTAELDVILEEGCLSRRILAALGGASPSDAAPPDRSAIAGVYRSLCECLSRGEMFRPAGRDDAGG